MKPETVDAAAWLRRAAAAEPVPELPPPGRLWWKAQIVRRLQEKEARIERAARPALWGLGIGGAVALATLGAAIALGLSHLLATLAALPVELPVGWITTALAAFVLPLAALVALFLLVRREAG